MTKLSKKQILEKEQRKKSLQEEKIKKWEIEIIEKRRKYWSDGKVKWSVSILTVISSIISALFLLIGLGLVWKIYEIISGELYIDNKKKRRK